MSNDCVQSIGHITKQCEGCMKECCKDSDHYLVQFPQDLDVKMKAVMIGACFLIVSFMISKLINELQSFELSGGFSFCEVLGNSPTKVPNCWGPQLSLLIYVCTKDVVMRTCKLFSPLLPRKSKMQPSVCLQATIWNCIRSGLTPLSISSKPSQLGITGGAWLVKSTCSGQKMVEIPSSPPVTFLAHLASRATGLPISGPTDASQFQQLCLSP